MASVRRLVGALAVRRLKGLSAGHDHHRGSEEALPLSVPGLNLGDHGSSLVLARLDLLDGLVDARVKGPADCGHPGDALAAERVGELTADHRQPLGHSLTSLVRWPLWIARSRLSNTGRRVRRRSSRPLRRA